MDLDLEPLITERKGGLTMGQKPKVHVYSSRKRRRSVLASLILTVAIVGLILAVTRLIVGRPVRFTNIQFILFEGETQLPKVDFVAEGM